nr:YcaO-like family protein [Barrientosiimonas endolithica]
MPAADPPARRDPVHCGDPFHRNGAGVRRLPAALPEQRADPGFPAAATYAQDRFTRTFSLLDQRPAWVPAALVSNDPGFGAIATSSGLAAGASVTTALLRATQELVERDALMVTWLHGLRPRTTPAPVRVSELVDKVDGGATVLDLTPRHSPHPVAMVVGSAPLPDRPRHGAGIACRATWAEAVEKATLEWAQAMTYVGVTAGGRPRPEPHDVVSFDEHARFYSLRPDLWATLPIHRGTPAEPPASSTATDAAEQLHELVMSLHRNGIRLFYRDLTTLDVAACGSCACSPRPGPDPRAPPVAAPGRRPRARRRAIPGGGAVDGVPQPVPAPAGMMPR